MNSVNFTVNNKPFSINVIEKRVSLLEWLRETTGLTGTKCGCGVGQCGSCYVLIDGKATKSCLVRVDRLGGKKIVTIEGLAQSNKLHPVQQCFIECGAVQCGFCTPGMIIKAVELLDNNLNPSRDDIVKSLGDNYCRCGTYPRVIEAIERAAAILRGELAQTEGQNGINCEQVIGQPFKMPDLVQKVTGKAKFADDYNFKNMLHGKILWSKHPYAAIKCIDVTAAQKVPGVKLVLTHQDLSNNLYGALIEDQPLLAEDKVTYIGQPVAVVFADSLLNAKAAVDQIKVDYEVLEGVYSVYRALEDDAPEIHPKGKLADHTRIEKGDVDGSFGQAEIVVEGNYSTPFIEHAYIETEAVAATPNEAGGIDLYIPTQGPFSEKTDIARLCGLEEKKVNIIQVTCGGSFGGKCEYPVLAFTALATTITGQPAKINLTRAESLRFHPKRHAYDMHYRLASAADGKLLAMDINLLSDAGAFYSYSPRAMPQSVAFSTGPYNVPHLRVDGKAVFTNNLVSGAMRGYGTPQVHFAFETQMDILARKLNIDPIQLRKQNALKDNDEMSTGQIICGGHRYINTLEIIEREIPEKLLPLKKDKNVGIGIASGWRHIAGGLGPDEVAGASISLQRSGKFLLKAGCSEMGQETLVGLAQIAAHVTGVPFNLIDIYFPIDTDKVPYGGAVMASRGLYLWGLAVETAGKKMKEAILKHASLVTGKAWEDFDVVGGMVVNKLNGTTQLSIQDLARQLSNLSRDDGTILEVEEYAKLPKTYPVQENCNKDGAIPAGEFRTHHTISYNTTAVAIKVNQETNNIQVLKAIVAVDAGRIINPEGARKQIEGGFIMGMGYGLSEEFIVKDGRNITNNFGKCKVPDISMIPDQLEVIFVDGEDKSGPLGAKGIGEIGILAVAPAIGNAVFDATGHRLYRLPLRLP